MREERFILERDGPRAIRVVVPASQRLRQGGKDYYADRHAGPGHAMPRAGLGGHGLRRVVDPARPDVAVHLLVLVAAVDDVLGLVDRLLVTRPGAKSRL